MNINEFVELYKIKLNCVAGGIPPDDFKECDPWVCTLTMEDMDNTMQTPFYTGVGLREMDRDAVRRDYIQPNVYTKREIEIILDKFEYDTKSRKDRYKIESERFAEYWKPVPPKVEDLLDCMALEAYSYDMAHDFEDWADEFGYDTDSRKAESIYRSVGESAKKLRNFLGSEIYTKLLTEVERL